MRRSPAIAYPAAALIAVIAQCVRLPLNPPTLFPYITFVPFIAVSAIFGGLGPGLLTCVLSALECLYFDIPPIHSFRVQDPSEWIGFLTFLVTGGLLGILSDLLRKAHRSVEVLAEMLDCTYDAAFVWESGRGITYWNQGAVRLYGFSRAEALGHDSHQLLATAFPVAIDEVERQLKDSGHWEGELLHATRDGRLVTIESRMTAAAGDVLRVLQIDRDISERTAAARSLRASQERLDLALEAADAAAWEMALDGGQPVRDDRFLRLFRIPADAFAGERGIDWIDLVVLGDRARVQSALATAFESGEPLDTEFRARRMDGAIRWYRVRGARHATAEGGRFVGVIQDATTQKRGEEVLRESEAQFRTLANAIPQLCWMTDSSGWIHWYNARWYEYTGTTPEQMEGWGWQAVHDPDVLPRVLERWKESITTGQPFEMIVPLRGRDGVFRPFLTLIVPVRDESGRITRWFGTNTDISEQRRTEEALRQSAERLRLTLEASRIGTFEYYPSSGRLFWDDRSRAIWGMESHEAVDLESVRQRIESADLPGTCKIIMAALAPDSGGSFEATFRILWAGGTVRWTVVRGEVLFEGEGDARRAVRMVGTQMDITSQKRMEQALENSNRDLEQFAYAVSHDLQEPLRMVSSYVDVLARRFSGLAEAAGAGEYMGYIRAGTARMHAMIRDILAFSRVSRADAASFAPVDLNEVLEWTRQNLATAIHENQAQVIAGPLPPVCGDFGQLGLVFQNLIGNAIKYRSAATPVITISATREREAVRISVHDNGTGINPCYHQRIFGLFKRLYSASEKPGTGIGLAISRRIIEVHNGHIWVESELGQGATFVFTLPAADSPAVEHTDGTPVNAYAGDIRPD